MNFSGKITNSIVSYLQHEAGADVSDMLEGIDLPVEFMRDPTSWLAAHKVEESLRTIDNFVHVNLSQERFIEKVGHEARKLKAWGVLDSVLRMIEKPADIFLQPQRFISYFISPAPPVANIRRHLNSVAFDLPISFEEFPFVLTYIKAAIEAVPLFMGGSQMADCRWTQNSVSISWAETQPTLDDPSLSQRQMAPELMQNLILTLEKTEKALHEKSLELDKIRSENERAAQSGINQPARAIIRNLEDGEKMRDVEEQSFATNIKVNHLKRSNENGLGSAETGIAFVKAAEAKQSLMKLQDYFTRSQQLITLLIGQDRKSSQIREAMRRVNWDQVQSSFPIVTRKLIDELESETQNQFHNFNPTIEKDNNEQDHQSFGSRDSRQPWLPYS